MFKNTPIRKKLMAAMLITSGVVLLLTCAAYFGYEYYSFRRATIEYLSIVGRMIGANSTAALAFDNADDAAEVLSSLQVEPHISTAVLYDRNGNIFAEYHSNDSINEVPQIRPDWQGFRLTNGSIAGVQPVTHEGMALGTLYLMSNMNQMYDRFTLYILIAALVIVVSFLVAYLLSLRLQKNLSQPILDLAQTARTISENPDYSVRARKYDNDEVGMLTEAFNRMLATIDHQNQEITGLNQDLEKKVAERTKDLEMAYREMEAFSYSVSHDLNAPLRQIDGYIGMFLSKYEHQLDEGGRKTLDNISRKTRRLRQLIDDLLAFSQLGRKGLDRTLVDMDQMVREIVSEYGKVGKSPEVKFEIGTLPAAFADAVTLRQVWENLISNAVKYSSHRNGARVVIQSRRMDDATVYMVRDNGAGFDMKYYHKLFNPFQRLHNQSEFEGTGVGLAIVERIISKHGGKVWAESKIDEGTTFYFTVPGKS